MDPNEIWLGHPVVGFLVFQIRESGEKSEEEDVVEEFENVHYPLLDFHCSAHGDRRRFGFVCEK